MKEAAEATAREATAREGKMAAKQAALQRQLDEQRDRVERQVLAVHRRLELGAREQRGVRGGGSPDRSYRPSELRNVRCGARASHARCSRPSSAWAA